MNPRFGKEVTKETRQKMRNKKLKFIYIYDKDKNLIKIIKGVINFVDLERTDGSLVKRHCINGTLL